MSDTVETTQSNENAIDAAALGAIAEQAGAEESATIESNAPEVVEIPTSEILYPVISLASGLLAPNWGITEEENKALSESYGVLVDKYVPNIGGSFGVELNAIIITGAILMPRLGKPAKIEAEESKAPEEKSGGGGSGGSSGLSGMGSETLDGQTVH